MNSIYDLVVATICKSMRPPTGVWETLYIKNGYFVGHKFHFDGGYALWASGWPAIEFYDEHRNLVRGPPSRGLGGHPRGAAGKPGFSPSLPEPCSGAYTARGVK